MGRNNMAERIRQTNNRPDIKDRIYTQQGQCFVDAMETGYYPIVDKDAAEEILEHYRQARGKRHPKVARVEEQIRDGHPIFTHIAISRLRSELAELIDNAHSQTTPQKRILITAQNEDFYAEDR